MYENQLPKKVKEAWPDFDWDHEKVWALDEPTVEMPIAELVWQLDIPFWESEGTDDWNLAPCEVIGHPESQPSHWKKIQEADTEYPIDVIEDKGRWVLLDGLHRLAKLYMSGASTVRVRKIPRSRIPEIVKP